MRLSDDRIIFYKLDTDPPASHVRLVNSKNLWGSAQICVPIDKIGDSNGKEKKERIRQA
jgi:hypothetical protein